MAAANLGSVRILGVDPGLRRCGWGVIESDGPNLAYVAHGVIRPPIEGALAQRLGALLDGLAGVIAAHAPGEAAVEETFVNANARSALALGQARGVSLAACAQARLHVAEYAPAAIKKALVGSGRADKTQIGFMVGRLLPRAGAVEADAADALAAALCHAAHRSFARRTGG